MRLLVTGATGFVGRNLILKLAADSLYSEVILLLRSPEKLEKQLSEESLSLPSHFRIIKTEAPHWGPDNYAVDHVIHGAGILSADDYQTYQTINVEGTREFFSRLTQPKKIVVLSSQAAGGPCLPTKSIRKESDTDTPVTWYGRSKLEMEEMLKEEFPNFPYICLRPPMVLGPRDSATLPLFQMAGQWVQVKPGGKPKNYSFISVESLVSAILTCLQSDIDFSGLPQKAFYVANPNTITDLDLIGTAAEVCGRTKRILRVPQGLISLASKAVSAVPKWRQAIPNLSSDRVKEIWPDDWIVSTEQYVNTFSEIPPASLEKVLSETNAWYKSSGQL